MVLHQGLKAVCIGHLPLDKKGSYDFTTVTVSEGKCIFSKTAHRVFLKLLMKLGCPKGKKLMGLDFWEKKSILWIMPAKHHENRVFLFFMEK